jgi:hypothetical protein
MQFSIRNILLANALIAFGLGILLSDVNSAIKRHAVESERDRLLIHRSQARVWAVDSDAVPGQWQGQLRRQPRVAANR